MTEKSFLEHWPLSLLDNIFQSSQICARFLFLVPYIYKHHSIIYIFNFTSSIWSNLFLRLSLKYDEHFFFYHTGAREMNNQLIDATDMYKIQIASAARTNYILFLQNKIFTLRLLKQVQSVQYSTRQFSKSQMKNENHLSHRTQNIAVYHFLRMG